MAATGLRSVVKQGILAPYRREYWKFLLQVLRRYLHSPAKLRMGIALMFSAHHFINYAKSLADELEVELRKITEPPGELRESGPIPAWQVTALAAATPAGSVATD